MKPFSNSRRKKQVGFTLIELLVSMGILSIIMIALVTALGQTQNLWTSTQDRAEKYREARVAFETISQRLSGTTLNTYWGYDDPERPTEYARQSELHFVVGQTDEIFSDDRKSVGQGVFFQAPFGYGGQEAGSLGGGSEYNYLTEALNCWGYYVEYNSDVEKARPLRPDFLEQGSGEKAERKRFRLMEYRLPTEKLNLFDQTYSNNKKLNKATSRAEIYKWFGDGDKRVANSSPVAENILAVILKPRAPGLLEGRALGELTIAPEYLFDSRRYQWETGTSLSEISRHQVPPVLDITLVSLSEATWVRYADVDGDAGADALIDFVGERFKKAKDFDTDLEELETELLRLNLDHRIFSTTIALRSGKWITSDTN